MMKGHRHFVLLAVLSTVAGSLLAPAGGTAARPSKPLSIRPLGTDPIAGNPVRFALAVRVPAHTHVTRFSVNFGDGKTIRRRRRPPHHVTHSYSRAGRYMVAFKVTDSAGRNRHIVRFLTVGPVPPTPIPGDQGTAPGGPGGPGGSVTPPAWVPPPLPPPPNPEIPVYGSPIQLQPGSSATADFGETIKVSGLEPPGSAPREVTVALENEQVIVSTGVGAPPTSTSLKLDAVGCIEATCDMHLKLWIPLAVVPLKASDVWLNEFTSPSPERLADAITIEDGVTALRDELLMTLGTATEPGSREEADAVAAAAGGVVSAGLETIGVYEIRWPGPQDIEARRTQLLALPNVTSVSLSTSGMLEDASVEPPGDWSDDGRQATWPFEQVRVGEAWDVTKGSDVTVGIVDGGLVYKKHEDLDVAVSLYGHAGAHATHVAGLACAKANGIGLVGMAWGCPIVSSGVRSGMDKDVLAAATAVAEQPDVQVVNMSMGYPYRGPKDDRCATAQQQQELVSSGQNYRMDFRHLFNAWPGREIVWTISAGNNCAEGAPGPMGANSDLENVITVAATNSDHSLASFSDFGDGVEVAAPGGVSAPPDGDGTVGVWSTWYVEHCWPLGFGCGTYHAESGTSMAAPVVAGIAALVRSAHPTYDAAAAADCITETAGTSTGLVNKSSPLPTDGHVRHVTYTPDSLAIVDAEAAVRCDTFGAVEDADYPGQWGPPDTEVISEGEATLGAINEEETWYTNGCTDPPGQKTFSGLTREPSGQWDGSAIAITSDCATHSYTPVAAMRIVRGASGHQTLVIAWSTNVNGYRPTIEPDGTIMSPDSFWEMRLERRHATTNDPAQLRSQRLLPPADPSTAAGISMRGAVLRPATE
jgi:subtilisin family serine protease